MCALAKVNIWPADRWREALHVWSKEGLAKRSWRYLAPVLAEAPDGVLLSLANGIGWWLDRVATTFDRHRPLFIDFCQRMLSLTKQEDVDDDIDDPLTPAINHPVGLVAEALLNFWTREALDDGQGLPDELRPVFTELCDTQVHEYRPGRIVLASRVITLFRVDGEWAKWHLLPLFDWRTSKDEARAAWSSFLHSPRFYVPLMEEIKEPFPATAQHYEYLGEYREQYAGFFCFAALEHRGVFDKEELAAATQALPQDGMDEVADALMRAMEGSGEQSAQYWRNRILPYLHSIWPRSTDRKTPEVSESLGGVCVAAGEAFPQALAELRHWLQPPNHPYSLIQKLNETGLCNQFPMHALEFLHLVTGDGFLEPDSLRDCLQKIRTAEPGLEEDPHFRRLREILHCCGYELR